MSDMETIRRQVKKIPGVTYAKTTIDKLLGIFSNQRSVAMLHMGRAGSSVLGNMLKVHSKVNWTSEIFQKYMVEDKMLIEGDFMNSVIEQKRNLRKTDVFGFETKYLPQQHLSERCLDMNIEEYIDALYESGINLFIVLHRKNYLRRAISVEVGRMRGSWHATTKTSAPTKVYIDTEAFLTGV